MHVETIYIPYKKMDDTFKLLPISDIHFGHKSCDKAKLVRDLKEKVDKRTIIVGVGDWADSILIKDAKRYRKEDDDNPTGEIADEQVEGLRQIFAPYADKVYAIGDGNHEDELNIRAGTNLMRRLCDALETDNHKPLYMGLNWLLDIVFYVEDENGNKSQTRSCLVRGHHGWGGAGRTEGGDITKYSHDVKFWDADLFLYGHTHKLKMAPVDRGRKTGKNSWRTDKKYMAVCGTYQRTYSNNQIPTWAERKGFPPVSLGTPTIYLSPRWNGGVEIKVEY